ncbi:MAG: hypothetical protein ACJ8F7_08870 [Gemmataceae bacterium]
MATFYLLPPRLLVEEAFARFVAAWLPGAPVSPVAAALTDTLETSLLLLPNAFLVFREELPDDVLPEVALRESFGAAVGDDIVEVHLGNLAGALVATRSPVSDAA